MISCKAMTKILYRNSEKSFLECEKNGLKKHVPTLFPREFFHVCGSCNFSLLKYSLVQINFKLNSKPYDYLLFKSRPFLHHMNTVFQKEKKFHPRWDSNPQPLNQKSNTLVHCATGASCLFSRTFSAFIKVFFTCKNHFVFPSIPYFGWWLVDDT